MIHVQDSGMALADDWSEVHVTCNRQEAGNLWQSAASENDDDDWSENESREGEVEMMQLERKDQKAAPNHNWNKFLAAVFDLQEVKLKFYLQS